MPWQTGRDDRVMRLQDRVMRFGTVKWQKEAKYHVHAKYKEQRQGTQEEHLTKQFNGPCRTTKGEAMGNIRTTKGMGNLLARAHTG